MRYLRYFVLLVALALPAAFSQAQVSFGVRVGHPVRHYYYYQRACPYGYYPTAYGCAPSYGYYNTYPRYHFYGRWDRDDRWHHRRWDHDRW